MGIFPASSEALWGAFASGPRKQAIPAYVADVSAGVVRLLDELERLDSGTRRAKTAGCEILVRTQLSLQPARRRIQASMNANPSNDRKAAILRGSERVRSIALR